MARFGGGRSAFRCWVAGFGLVVADQRGSHGLWALGLGPWVVACMGRGSHGSRFLGHSGF